MKKIIFSLSALAALLLAGSCQRENLEPVLQGGTVTYTVQVPGALATKADGDGFVAYYEVYRQGDVEDDTKSPVYEGSKPFENGSANIELEFVKNQKFVVLFWAQKEGAKVYDIEDLRKVSISKAQKLTSNNFDAEVFAGNDLVENCASKKGGNVVLFRPIAQLNIATDSEGLFLGTTPVQLNKSYVKVTGLSATYNVYEGYGSTETANAVYGMADVPTGTITVGTESYNYVAMNYIGFMPQSDITVDVDFTIQTSEGNINHTVSNVPIKANYKTNIIGNLITATDNYQVTLGAWADAEITHPMDGVSLQTALDNAVPGTTIQLEPGVNYGTLYLRPSANADVTKVVDWVGNNYRYETYSLFQDITIKGAEGATVDAIEIEGGTYYNTPHSQSSKYPIMLSLIELKNVVIDGVTFTGKGGYDPQGHGNAINLSGNNIKVDSLTIQNCTLNNPENNARLIYKTESTTTEHKYTYDDQTKALQEYTFTPSLKNIKVTGTTFDGGYIGLELRETENVTITNNTFNVADRNILLPVNSGCTYSGKVTITDNVSNNAKQRFVRMSGAGDAEVVIKNNTINNYQGADADYIKVEGGNNVTIQNNPISYGEIIYDIDLKNGEIVTLPAKEGDRKVFVKGQGTLVLNGTTITTTEGPAIELAEDAKVALQVNGDVELTGATNGILVNGATLSVTGTGNLEVVGKAGSGINGSVTIDGLARITSKGNGDHAYGIGGIGANVVIKNSTVDYACGGHIQPLFINDTKYGKSEPEGGAAIGGATVKIEGSTITKVDGGSKAAAIGERFWQSTSIEILNSTISEANGGNASAGIGGSRYGDGDKYDVSIKIQNSNVTATGGQHGAGIGSGYDTHCNGQDYTAENKIEIDENSVINAKGGKYAAGIGTGFHSAYLTGSIAAGATINAESGEAFYKDSYTTAQNIGYGVVDPAREYSGANATITFSVAGNVIGTPYGIPVAQVGDTQYKSIDEAIAAWTNGSTLTLLADVTLSDVVTLKSTEHHILNLSKFTMTAASGKNAFEIKACGTGDAERTAITINADATNPGGINAGSKSIIYYKYADGGISVNDRPIIKINGGVFNGSTSAWGTAGINFVGGSKARMAATLNITGGIFNCSINGSGKSKLLISGGTFHYSVGSQGDSTAYRQITGDRFKTFGFMTADSENTKFAFGTNATDKYGPADYNVGVYVDDENYLVVGGSVITEFGDKFAAKATNATEWSSYLQYSSAAANGLYYTNAQMAIDKHKEANVVLK